MIVLDDRGDLRRGAVLADGDRAGQGGQGGTETLRLVGAELEQRLAGLHPVTRLGQADDPRGRADRVLLAGPARPEPPGRRAHRQGVQAGQPAGRGSGQDLSVSRPRQRRVGVAALRADHRPVGGQRPAVRDGGGGIASCVTPGRPGRASGGPGRG